MKTDPRIALAKRVMDKASSVAKSDLAIIRTQQPRGTKRNPLPPWDVEVHVNPVSIAVGTFGLAAASLLAVGKLNAPTLMGGSVTIYRGPFRTAFLALTGEPADLEEADATARKKAHCLVTGAPFGILGIIKCAIEG